MSLDVAGLGQNAATVDADSLGDLLLLCARRERPRGRRAAKQGDEFPPLRVEHGDFLPYALQRRRPARALGFSLVQP